jgi:3-methyladenine DNA glycosylase AlkD
MLAAAIRAALGELADPGLAAPMAAYMKVAENGTLPFLGIRRPVVRRTARGLARGSSPDELLAAVEDLWDHARFREERYAARDLLGLAWARGRLDLLPLHEHHILTGAWWDHVDETVHRVADLVVARPEEMTPVLRAWSTSENRWLRRAAILSQLGRREQTDRELLAELIGPNLADPDFFIRKAIGWALREVARWDPDWVLRFAATHELSALTRREALKHVL